MGKNFSWEIGEMLQEFFFGGMEILSKQESRT